MSSTHMPQKADWLSCVTVAANAGFDGLELFGARYAREADMAPDQLDAIARAARARNLTLSGHPWVEWGDLPLAALFPRLDRVSAKWCCIWVFFRTGKMGAWSGSLRRLTACILSCKGRG